jgi:hypothetical protein
MSYASVFRRVRSTVSTRRPRHSANSPARQREHAPSRARSLPYLNCTGRAPGISSIIWHFAASTFAISSDGLRSSGSRRWGAPKRKSCQVWTTCCGFSSVRLRKTPLAENPSFAPKAATVARYCGGTRMRYSGHRRPIEWFGSWSPCPETARSLTRARSSTTVTTDFPKNRSRSFRRRVTSCAQGWQPQASPTSTTFLVTFTASRFINAARSRLFALANDSAIRRSARCWPARSFRSTSSTSRRSRRRCRSTRARGRTTRSPCSGQITSCSKAALSFTKSICTTTAAIRAASLQRAFSAPLEAKARWSFIRTTSNRLSDLARWLPDLAAEIATLQPRIIDLLSIIRRHVYDRAFNGSFSLKSVLPALVPSMGYEDLAIRDGSFASLAILEIMAPETSPERRAELRAQLLAYCKRDTEALVKLFQLLR